MGYIRDWETIAEARERLVNSGIEENQAATDLCHAIADQKIGVRALIAKNDYYGGALLESRQLGVPKWLSPSDFDWENSRPNQGWEGGRYPDDLDWGRRDIQKLEISTGDVNSVFATTLGRDKVSRGVTKNAGRYFSVGVGKVAPEKLGPHQPATSSQGAGQAGVQMTNALFGLEEVVSANNLEGFKDVFWNLGQIVAWVETRSPFPVDALSDSTKGLARRDHSMPAGLPHFAAELADRSADENRLARIKSPFQSLDDVRRVVLRSFQSGLLTASGQRRGSLDREPITPLEWADLTIDDSLAGEMTLRNRDGFVEAWNDVRVKGDDVISAFPMPTTLLGDARTDGDGVFDSPAQETKPTSPSYGAKNLGGTGKMTRAIQAAFRELWPSGEIPVGMSSQDRNDKILVELKLEKYSVPTEPNKRTIERALKSLNK